MKSQVGLGRLYPDGRLDYTREPPTGQHGDTAHSDDAPSPAAEVMRVVVHVEKTALDDLLQEAAQP